MSAKMAAMALVMAASGYLSGSQRHVVALDLVESRRSTDEQMATVESDERFNVSSFIPPISPHNVAPLLPVAITLVAVNATAYRPFDEVNYEVVLRNTGKMAVQVPVSTEHHLFRRSMARLAVASIGLLFTDDLLGIQHFASESLYGAPSIKGSLIVLSANESMSVRIRGPLTVFPPSGTPRSWLRPVEIKSQFGLYTKDGSIYGTSVSANSVQVQLRNEPGRR